ncbi:MAG: transcription antitermination factor NusB [Coxiella-like endosymbiont]|uniref:transcription antitermination factor NusB n=1 Tax=Coxiella-like endosymbiont TaxID=1592897 RepID=UPI00215A354F|nr:transcription antitermination factor NusB [Coxiella-like endosymbiont]UVE59475.1 transcription antitermination factor NusB [Coxiella-like endosymbiont]
MNSRHNARRYALQGLYQWYFGEVKPDDLINQFLEENALNDLPDVDLIYFKDLVIGTIQHVAFIDALMIPHLDRKISSLNPVELSALRLAIYELLHRKDVPYKVVINEALELVKEFGAEEGHRYVNAILDVLVPELRKKNR